jgi:hypothetical protein
MDWKHINDKWLNILPIIHAIYVRLGLALDGVNPFGDLSSCDFTRLIIILNYSFPP